MQTEESIKIAIVGDSAIGKTSLIHRFCNENFLNGNESLKIENEAKEILLNGTSYMVNLVEPGTSEQDERYRPFYYKNAKAIILCYSIEDHNSFYRISKKWIPELLEIEQKPFPVLLVATKSDLRNDKNCIIPLITVNEGECLAKEIGAKNFIECSALNNESIKDVIEEALRIALEKKKSKKKKHCIKGVCAIN